MQTFTPCLWFDGNAEDAVRFYVSIFKKSRIISVNYYGDAASEVSGQPKGSVMTVAFQLDGQEFLALNGGPAFKFTPAVSFIVNCSTQEEVDDLWERLSDGGEIMDCGWLTDKYGLSWQITPTVLGEMLQDKDPCKTERVMQAMIQMKKLDIAQLKKAYEQD